MAFADAVYRLNLSCYYATSDEDARIAYIARSHSIVIIDTRSSKQLDGIALCRLLRSIDGSAFSVFVAVRTRCVKVRAMLYDAGFDQDFMEMAHADACYDELMFLFRRAAVLSRMRSAEAMFAACEWSDDAVEISSPDHLIQYVNPACAKALNYSAPGELVGRHVDEAVTSDKNPIDIYGKIQQQLEAGQPWQGNYSVRKKTGESISLMSRIVPVKGSSGRIFGYVTLRRLEGMFCTMCILPQEPARRSERRTSVHFSEYNDSSNVASTVMTPSNSFHEPYKVVDQMFGMIRSQSSLQMLGMASSSVIKVRRESIGNTQRVVMFEETGSLPLMKNANVRKQLDVVLTWKFDVIALEEVCKLQCLQYVGFEIFRHFNMASVLSIDDRTLTRWLQMIESHYHTTVTFHNSTHAADVLQASAFFCEQPCIMHMVEEVDKAALLIAAAVHDVDHMGRTSSFLVNAEHSLALLYNDISVLENYHVSTAFTHTLRDPDVNIFRNLDKTTYRALRRDIIELVLATDMSKHVEHLQRFKNHLPSLVQFYNAQSVRSLNDNAVLPPKPAQETVQAVKRLIIKTSDICNPLRSTKLCVEWAVRIAEEYFDQVDEEKSRGLPVVMAMFDRDTCSLPKTQLVFTDLFVTSMIDALNQFCPAPELMRNLTINRDYWQELYDSGDAMR